MTNVVWSEFHDHACANRPPTYPCVTTWRGNISEAIINAQPDISQFGRPKHPHHHPTE